MCFHDHADLIAQLLTWLLEVNTVRPCRATGVPPAARIAVERERLRPLSIPAAEYALRFSVFVGPTGLVSFQGYRYSMPPETIGIPGMLWLYAERVRIAAGRFEREHARVPEQGKDSFHPEDRTARLAQVAGKRGRLYLKRQELLDLEWLAQEVGRPEAHGLDDRAGLTVAGEHDHGHLGNALLDAILELVAEGRFFRIAPSSQIGRAHV